MPCLALNSAKKVSLFASYLAMSLISLMAKNPVGEDLRNFAAEQHVSVVDKARSYWLPPCAPTMVVSMPVA